jgi:hypothetical protein
MRKLAALLSAVVTCGAVAAATSPASAVRGSDHPAPHQADPSARHGCPLPHFGPGRHYHPHLDPAGFSPHVTNPWFPLPTGTTWLYTGLDTGSRVVDIVSVSRATRTIEGVRARVVHDRLFADGVLAETTDDYYAQDRCGNVWYFGEDTAELDRHGRVTSRAGSWLAGHGGAQPGVFMQTHPKLGRKFRQEWLRGEAEDVFAATARHARVTSPYGTFRALRTRETSALEPRVVDAKHYVRGIGEVSEASVKGGHETLALVDVVR